MSTYHFSLKKGKCGYAVKHVDYILREGKYSKARSGREDLVYKEVGNLPEWARSAQEFWKASDDFERANGVSYFEFEVALPNELDHEENIKLVQNFVAETIGSSKPYSFAIHEKNAALSDEIKQPHAHIMFCERIVEHDIDRSKEKFFSRYNPKYPNRGGAKKDTRFTSIAGKKTLIDIRKKCEDAINKSYEKKGLKIRVSAATLKAQYNDAIAKNDMQKAQIFDRPAEPHLGPKEVAKIKRESKQYKSKKEYYLYFASEKAYDAYIARIIKDKAKELEKLQQDIANLNGQVQNNAAVISHAQQIPEEVIKTAGRDISNLLEKHIVYMEKQCSDMLAARNKLKQFIIPDERLRLIAESVYTKGNTTSLRKDLNVLEKREAAYKARYEMWLKNKPGSLDFVNKYKHTQEKQKLDAFRIDLDRQKADYDKRATIIKEEISRPEVQAKLDNIVKELREKVKVAEARYAVYDKNINTINNQILLAKNIKRDIDKNYYGSYLKIRSDTYKILQNHNLSQGKNMINDLRYAVNKAESNRVNASTNARFSGKSYDEGREE